MINVYRETLQSYAPAAIAIRRASTGGVLSLVAVHRMMQMDLPLPGAIFAGTPWSDLTVHYTEFVSRVQRRCEVGSVCYAGYSFRVLLKVG